MRTIYIVALALLTVVGVLLVNFLPFKEQVPLVAPNQESSLEIQPQESDVFAEKPVETAPLGDQHVPVWHARPNPTPAASLDDVTEQEPPPSAQESQPPDQNPEPIQTSEPPPVPTPDDVPEQEPPPSAQESQPSDQNPEPIQTSETPLVPTPDDVPEQEPPPSAQESQPPDQNTVPDSYVYFYTGVPIRTVPPPAAVGFSGGLGFLPAAPVVTTPVSTTPILMPSIPVVQSYGVPVFVPQVVPSPAGVSPLFFTNGFVIQPNVYYPKEPLRTPLWGPVR